MTNKIDRWMLGEVGCPDWLDGLYIIKPIQIFNSKSDALLAKKYFSRVWGYDVKLAVVHCDDINEEINEEITEVKHEN